MDHSQHKELARLEQEWEVEQVLVLARCNREHTVGDLQVEQVQRKQRAMAAELLDLELEQQVLAEVQPAVQEQQQVEELALDIDILLLDFREKCCWRMIHHQLRIHEQHCRQLEISEPESSRYMKSTYCYHCNPST